MPSLGVNLPRADRPRGRTYQFVVNRARFAAYGCDQDTSAPADVYASAADDSDCKCPASCYGKVRVETRQPAVESIPAGPTAPAGPAGPVAPSPCTRQEIPLDIMR